MDLFLIEIIVVIGKEYIRNEETGTNDNLANENSDLGNEESGDATGKEVIW
jgi:hypothetical protein